MAADICDIYMAKVFFNFLTEVPALILSTRANKHKAGFPSTRNNFIFELANDGAQSFTYFPKP